MPKCISDTTVRFHDDNYGLTPMPRRSSRRHLVPATTDMIVIGPLDRHGPTMTHRMIERLSLDRQIVWIATDRQDAANAFGPFVAADSSRGAVPASDPRRGWQDLDEDGGCSQTIIHPPVSRFGNPLSRWINRRILQRVFGRIERLRDLRDPILWVASPTAAPILDVLPAAPMVYVCDRDSECRWSEQDHALRKAEAALVDRADLIVTPGRRMAERFPRERVRWVPYGCDPALFSVPAQRAADLPGGRVVGFLGAFTDDLDHALIHDVASLLPHWTFVFIGAVLTDPGPLLRMPNLRFLGPRHRRCEPSYAQHWSVTWHPYRTDRPLHAVDSIGLRDGLAAGTPAVSTDVSFIEGYRHVVTVGIGPHGIVQALKLSIAHRNLDHARRAAVRRETWDSRAELIRSLLDGLPRQDPAIAGANWAENAHASIG